MITAISIKRSRIIVYPRLSMPILTRTHANERFPDFHEQSIDESEPDPAKPLWPRTNF